MEELCGGGVFTMAEELLEDAMSDDGFGKAEETQSGAEPWSPAKTESPILTLRLARKLS